MARCLISFGANIGDTTSTVSQAAEELAQRLGCQSAQFRCSRHFKTPPIGGPSGQPPFVNAVAAVETSLGVEQVWQAIQDVEHDFGRQRNQRWEARKLDLDILLYEDVRIWTARLKVPHPRMCMRRFILLPACDVAPDWLDPVSGQTMQELAERVQTNPASLSISAAAGIELESIVTRVAEVAGAIAIERTDCRPQTTRWLHPTSGDIENSFESVGDSGIIAANLWVHLEGGNEELRQGSERVSDAPVDWEEHYRSQADMLNLTGSSVQGVPSLRGPRYLLAANDREWAIHELVAALEAMDCPVEPLF